MDPSSVPSSDQHGDALMQGAMRDLHYWRRLAFASAMIAILGVSLVYLQVHRDAKQAAYGFVAIRANGQSPQVIPEHRQPLPHSS